MSIHFGRTTCYVHRFYIMLAQNIETYFECFAAHIFQFFIRSCVNVAMRTRLIAQFPDIDLENINTRRFERFVATIRYFLSK